MPDSSFDLKTILYVALAVITVFYVVVLTRGLQRARTESSGTVTPTRAGLATGFVTNFFDTLGIGSFATTTAIFRQWRMVLDERIPGTLNVGHTLPTIVQAYIFTKLVPVDGLTLALMIVAAVLGSWLGAGVVSGWPRRNIQIGMGCALLVAATLMLMAQLNLIPGGGTLLKLDGTRLVIGLAGNFVLGALMPMGIGLYGPCMILIYLLGMDPKAAFPIMMGSCAFLMPIGSARFVREKAFDVRAVLGLAIGGVPAVLIAAFIVESMPLEYVRWLVVVVVVYTAVTMLRSAVVEMGSSETLDTFLTVAAGATIGGVLALLYRPSLGPLLGQLPVRAVISRGANLSGAELALLPAAQQAFNYFLGGVLIGAGGGWFAWNKQLLISVRSTRGVE